ncbi:hypothetical protein [Telluribacter humicola]|nr:hypothetical protein [Telluribacter humicola]
MNRKHNLPPVYGPARLMAPVIGLVAVAAALYKIVEYLFLS